MACKLLAREAGLGRRNVAAVAALFAIFLRVAAIVAAIIAAVVILSADPWAWRSRRDACVRREPCSEGGRRGSVLSLSIGWRGCLSIVVLSLLIGIGRARSCRILGRGLGRVFALRGLLATLALSLALAFGGHGGRGRDACLRVTRRSLRSFDSGGSISMNIYRRCIALWRLGRLSVSRCGKSLLGCQRSCCGALGLNIRLGLTATAVRAKRRINQGESSSGLPPQQERLQARRAMAPGLQHPPQAKTQKRTGAALQMWPMPPRRARPPCVDASQPTPERSAQALAPEQPRRKGAASELGAFLLRVDAGATSPALRVRRARRGFSSETDASEADATSTAPASAAANSLGFTATTTRLFLGRRFGNAVLFFCQSMLNFLPWSERPTYMRMDLPSTAALWGIPCSSINHDCAYGPVCSIAGYDTSCRVPSLTRSHAIHLRVLRHCARVSVTQSLEPRVGGRYIQLNAHRTAPRATATAEHHVKKDRRCHKTTAVTSISLRAGSELHTQAPCSPALTSWWEPKHQ